MCWRPISSTVESLSDKKGSAKNLGFNRPTVSRVFCGQFPGIKTNFAAAKMCAKTAAGLENVS